MNYIVKAYDDYDSHSYGTPWAVPCDSSGRPNFKAAQTGHFTGGRGKGGNLYVTDPEENSVWAYGQKCYEGSVKASYQFFQFYGGELHPLVPAAVPDAVNEWEKSRKPKTNADRIRSYDDGELYEFICGLTSCEICRFASSNGCLLKAWLHDPAGED